MRDPMKYSVKIFFKKTLYSEKTHHFIKRWYKIGTIYFSTKSEGLTYIRDSIRINSIAKGTDLAKWKWIIQYNPKGGKKRGKR